MIRFGIADQALGGARGEMDERAGNAGTQISSDSRSIVVRTATAMQSKRGSIIAQYSPVATGLIAASNKATTQRIAISLRKEIMDDAD